jgi:hypothetical protein
VIAVSVPAAVVVALVATAPVALALVVASRLVAVPLPPATATATVAMTLGARRVLGAATAAGAAPIARSGAARIAWSGAARVARSGAAHVAWSGAARVARSGAARVAWSGAAHVAWSGAARVARSGAARVARPGPVVHGRNELDVSRARDPRERLGTVEGGVPEADGAGRKAGEHREEQDTEPVPMSLPFLNHDSMLVACHADRPVRPVSPWLTRSEARPLRRHRPGDACRLQPCAGPLANAAAHNRAISQQDASCPHEQIACPSDPRSPPCRHRRRRFRWPPRRQGVGGVAG